MSATTNIPAAELQAIADYVSTVDKAAEAFADNGSLMTWITFYEQKENAVTELIALVPNISAVEPRRIVQSAQGARAYSLLVQGLTLFRGKSRFCEACEIQIEFGTFCEACGAAKKEADKARRKAGRVVKRRSKQLLKRKVKRNEKTT